jgi:trimethylamine:corrinoid methyltransferase-like protein
MKTEKELRKELKQYKKQEKFDLERLHEIKVGVKAIKELVGIYVEDEKVIRKIMYGCGDDVDRIMSDLNIIDKKIHKLIADNTKCENLPPT